MGQTIWRRGVAAAAAVSLVAAAVVLTAADSNPGRAVSVGADAASINPVVDVTDLKAAVRNRHTQLTQRAEGGTAKLRPVLFITTLLAGLLMAAAAGWLTRPTSSGRPSLERRRHAVSLRGPPLFQLA